MTGIAGRRLGLLGGTFDPIHAGHLEAAAIAHRMLKLETVRLMPSMTPPHRHPQPQASPFHRFAMVALAVTDREGLVASDHELGMVGPSYTFDTLIRLQQDGFAPTDLFFVLGADAFTDIATWHRYPAVLDAAHFIVVSRPGARLGDLRERVPELGSRMVDAAAFEGANGAPRVVLLPGATPEVSSTEIRRRVAAGEPLDGLTPAAVITHIERHGLYKVDC